jgi:hypothetical protein
MSVYVLLMILLTLSISLLPPELKHDQLVLSCTFASAATPTVTVDCRVSEGEPTIDAEDTSPIESNEDPPNDERSVELVRQDQEVSTLEPVSQQESSPSTSTEPTRLDSQQGNASNESKIGHDAGGATPERKHPEHAVIQGNFTVWTVPAMPTPGEPYSIIIEIRYPKHLKRYPSNDISGVVVGTDGYRKTFPGSIHTTYRRLDHTVQITVPVVGGQSISRDTIYIQSRILRQRRVLLLDYAKGFANFSP